MNQTVTQVATALQWVLGGGGRVRFNSEHKIYLCLENNLSIYIITEAFFNQNKADAVDALYAADAIHHSPVGDLNIKGRKMVRAGYGLALPDFAIKTENLIGDGDWIAVRYTFTGTFRGQLMMPDGSAVPGNDAPISMTILSQYHFNRTR